MFTATRTVVNQGGLHLPGENNYHLILIAPLVRSRTKCARLLRKMEQFGGNSPDIGLNSLDRLSGIDHMDLPCRPDGLI
jgi:hypothetical protein